MISMRGSRDPAPQAKHEPADANAPHDLARDDGGERSRRPRSNENDAGAHRRDREAVEDERGRVVRQSFALENDEEAPRKLHAPRDRQRRDRVGRRHNGAQDEADRPGKAQQPMGRRRDRDRGEHDAADRQQRDRAQVEAELVPAHRHRVDSR